MSKFRNKLIASFAVLLVIALCGGAVFATAPGRNDRMY